jgi:peptidyl-prolyl cis-trans isomerase D
MLQQIRDIVSGWAATIIVAILIIPFAFWGINYYFDVTGDRVVASVNDREIKLSEYQRALENYRQQIRALLGDKLDPQSQDLVKREALRMIVDNEVLAQATRDTGMRVSDAQVAGVISGLDAFRDGERFDRGRYEQGLSRLGLTPAAFEEQLRTDMLVEQLQSAVIESSFVTDAELKEFARIQNQRRDIAYLNISAEPLISTLEISDEDVQRYYQEHPADYIDPEQVRIAYIELSIEALAREVAATEDELRAYYEQDKPRYDVEEARRISQLYIKLPADASPERVENARNKAGFLMEKVRAGEPFETIAEKYSEELGADFELITLGFTPRGVMDPEIEKKVYAMQEGEISEPVQSKSGIHIIKLEEIKGGVKNTFENARAEVEQDYRRRRAEELFLEQADRLTTLAYEHPDSLEPAAETIGAEVRVSDWFSRAGGEGIAAEPKVVLASFADDVLAGGNNSEPIELDNDRLIMLRVVEHKPQRRKSLDEVRAEIIEDIRYERAAAATRALGEKILAELRAGASLDEVASRHNVQWQEAKAITRDDVSVSRSILRVAFRLGQPAAGKSLYGGVALGTGDYVVVAVLGAHDPETIDPKDEKLAALRQQLEQARAEAGWRNLVDEFKARAEIRVMADNL